MRDPVRFALQFDVDAAPERLWPILADTERLNRQVGLPATQPTSLSGEPVRVARVRARMGGVRLEWDEDPFEFVEERYYWVRRRMLRGPILQFNGGLRFEPVGALTRVHVESEMVPANAAGQVAVAAILSKARGDWAKMMAGVEQHLRGEREHPYGEGVDLAPEAVRRLTAERLKGADSDFLKEPLAGRLCAHLASSGDAALSRIRPFALARAWDADRLAALRLCLRAAAAGVLDLSWDLLCPNCRGARNRWSTLEQVRGRSHCDDCQIDFNANFDRAVEVTFRPNPRYRKVEEIVYCSGGPGNTPHLVAQSVLDPGASTTLNIPCPAGRYRLRNLTADLAAWLYVETDGAANEVAAVFDEPGLELESGGDSVRAGPLTLRAENRTSTRQQIILERFADFEDRATAAAVTMFQEFRDLFGRRELLSPTTQLGIQTLPLLFTDLKGSTALYGRLGDASAYVLVRDHFELLQQRVARHGGGVVKTIGDAVMAAFPTPGDAVRCALEIHRDLAGFNQARGEPLSLKIGLHQGSCIAVRSYDDRLDYFGGTVNLAARTHEESRGDDVVMTAAMLDDAEVSELLAPVPQDRFRAELRGIGNVELVRFFPP